MPTHASLKVLFVGFFLCHMLTAPATGQCVNYCQGCNSFSWSTQSISISCNGLGVSDFKSILADVPLNANKLQIDGGNFYGIPETAFQDRPLKELNELQVINSQLQDISNYAFSQLSVLQKLDLRNNRIFSLMPNSFDGLRNLITLDLSNNALQKIPSADLLKSLYSLQKLDLSNNQLSDLPSEFLSFQSNLQEIRLEQNANIVNLRGVSFKGIRNLRKFYASGCGILTIENDWFQAVSSVETLDLSNNKIRSLPTTDSFRILQSLRHLMLSGNQIDALVDGQFAGLDLTVLDLSKNLISSVSGNAFMYMKGANQVDLSGNKIHTLPSFVFQPISSEISTLKLNDNLALINIPGEIFNGMQKMQELNLSSCAIQDLSDNLFQQVFSLRRIDVSNNWLKSLPQSFIDKANYMQYVNIVNNPWHCDCNIQPLQVWLQAARTSTILQCSDFTPMGHNSNCQRPKCFSPARLADRDIMSLSLGEMELCENISESKSSPIGIIIGIVAALVVIALIIIITACCLYRRHKRGQPLLCFEHPDYSGRKDKKPPKQQKQSPEKHEYEAVKQKFRKEPKGRKDHYVEKKEKRRIDADSSSLNESDKSFVVRNFFHSMAQDPEGESEGTQSMTRKDSQESLSQSGIGYGSRRGSRCSSQYSLNAGLNIESAV